MYTSIHFATLQLQHSTEGDVTTLSKTSPVYEKGFFILSGEDIKLQDATSKEIKAAINSSLPKEFYSYLEMLNIFQWHLN